MFEIAFDFCAIDFGSHPELKTGDGFRQGRIKKRGDLENRPPRRMQARIERTALLHGNQSAVGAAGNGVSRVSIIACREDVAGRIDASRVVINAVVAEAHRRGCRRR